MHCPFCRHDRLPGHRLARRPTTAPRSAAAVSARSAAPVHHRRGWPAWSVVKRCGVTEPFSRAKVVAGVRKACQGRPVTEDDLALLAQRVEEAVRASGRGRGRRATTSAWRSSARCASSTRSPTCASPASTAPSSPSRTSRPRSRCCAPSASPWGSSPPSRRPAPTRRKPAEPAPPARPDTPAHQTLNTRRRRGSRRPRTMSNKRRRTAPMTETVDSTPNAGSGAKPSQAQAPRGGAQGPEPWSASSRPRACTPTTR